MVAWNFIVTFEKDFFCDPIFVHVGLNPNSENGMDDGFQLVSRSKKVHRAKRRHDSGPFETITQPEKKIELNQNDKEFPPLVKSCKRLCINEPSAPILKPKPKKSKLLVFDTNMWMTSDGQEVILDVMINSNTSKIFVPWIVSHELDKKKATSDLARTGLSYRESFVQAYNDRIINQTAIERSETKEVNEWIGKNDDEILACCLNLKSNGFEVALSTKDKNLKVDAIANGITTYPPVTSFEKKKIKKDLEKSVQHDQLNSEFCRSELMKETLNFSLAFFKATKEQREKAWKIFE